jgi:hypothetical protein
MEPETPPAEAAAHEPTTAIEPKTEDGGQKPEDGGKTEATERAATGTTTTTVEEPGQKAGEDAVGVEGYEQAKAKALAEAAAAKAPKKEEPPPAEAAEIPAAAAEEPAAAAMMEEPVVPAVTEEDEDKDPVRIRIAGLEDSHLIASANRIARKEKITFAQAWERVAPKKAEPAPNRTDATNGTNGAVETVAPAKSETGRTRTEIEADITALDGEFEQAGKDLDTTALGVTLRKKERALDRELREVEAAESRAEQERQNAEKTKFESSVKDAQDRATKNWPEIADDNSALSKRMVELADAYERNPDLAHHVFEADAPFFFADLAAKELGLLPKDLRKPAAPAPATTKPTTPAATKPALRNQSAVVRPAQPAAAPASGAARTAEGPVVDPLGLDKIRSPYDYEQAKAKAMAGAT